MRTVGTRYTLNSLCANYQRWARNSRQELRISRRDYHLTWIDKRAERLRFDICISLAASLTLDSVADRQKHNNSICETGQMWFFSFFSFIFELTATHRMPKCCWLISAVFFTQRQKELTIRESFLPDASLLLPTKLAIVAIFTSWLIHDANSTLFIAQSWAMIKHIHDRTSCLLPVSMFSNILQWRHTENNVFFLFLFEAPCCKNKLWRNKSSSPFLWKQSTWSAWERNKNVH